MATASQSLFNMSVGQDNTPSTAALLMPKLQYRFRVLFLNFGVGGSTQELTRQVIDVSRPQVSFGVSTPRETLFPGQGQGECLAHHHYLLCRLASEQLHN